MITVTALWWLLGFAGLFGFLAGLFVAVVAHLARLAVAARRDARDALRRERQLLDEMVPPAGTVPHETLAAGRARLNAAVHTPTVGELYERLPDLPDWPAEGDPQ